MGIDPGGTSGIAVRNDDGVLATCVAKTPEELYDFILKAKVSGGLTHIVIENFIAATISSDGLHTVRIVGGVRAVAHILGIGITIHVPQDRYAFQEDAKQTLKELGGGVIHEQDALAHLLRYEYDNKC